MTQADSLIGGTASCKLNPGDELERKVSAETVIRRDEPLGKKTTLRVGGPADWYVEPATEADLAQVLQFCSERNLPLFVLGRGSNLLVKDGGFRGLVACLAHPNFSRIELVAQDLCCGAGARLKAVALEAKRFNLAGLEFLEGIPGSVGGALRMNAGAMGGQVFERVVSVRVMNLAGQVEIRQPADMAVRYRLCEGLRREIALGAVLRGFPGLRVEIEQRMNEFSRKRWRSQPAAPSAGCMFKNPLLVPAGRLIEELGLKGTRVGGAMVSMEHGNFLVNDGTATARDVLELIDLIQSRARSKRGIELETEVEIIGE
jgi:UDP-N-acetylenolpyruvoylglucosamine reductase